jgi:hypothetical protein
MNTTDSSPGPPPDGTEPGGGACREAARYRLVIPAQSLVVRLNGLDPDAPEDDYLPAVRPYGFLRMAWAVWREVPGVSPKAALSISARIRRDGEAEVIAAPLLLAEHVRMRLLVRHLNARLERLGSSLLQGSKPSANEPGKRSTD